MFKYRNLLTASITNISGNISINYSNRNAYVQHTRTVPLSLLSTASMCRYSSNHESREWRNNAYLNHCDGDSRGNCHKHLCRHCNTKNQTSKLFFMLVSEYEGLLDTKIHFNIDALDLERLMFSDFAITQSQYMIDKEVEISPFTGVFTDEVNSDCILMLFPDSHLIEAGSSSDSSSSSSSSSDLRKCCNIKKNDNLNNHINIDKNNIEPQMTATTIRRPEIKSIPNNFDIDMLIALKNIGYTVHYIWESDYRQYLADTINTDCVQTNQNSICQTTDSNVDGLTQNISLWDYVKIIK